MIQANELRPNNLVELIIPTTGSVIEKCRVKGNILKVNKHFVWNDLHEYCKPIPLTEDLLLKYGFEKDDIQDFLTKDFLAFELMYDTDMSMYFHDGRDWNSNMHGKIQYVHQLQNLYFALTGTELEIKL